MGGIRSYKFIHLRPVVRRTVLYLNPIAKNSLYLFTHSHTLHDLTNPIFTDRERSLALTSLVLRAAGARGGRPARGARGARDRRGGSADTLHTHAETLSTETLSALVASPLAVTSLRM